MTREEIIARSAELRLDRVLEKMGIGARHDDPFERFTNPEPPRDLQLNPVKRHLFALRRKSR